MKAEDEKYRIWVIQLVMECQEDEIYFQSGEDWRRMFDEGLTPKEAYQQFVENLNINN